MAKVLKQGSGNVDFKLEDIQLADLPLSANWDFTGTVSHNGDALLDAGNTTDDLSEGSTNLYHTDARAVSAIKADAAWNAGNWDTAYGWGDHSAVGYLTSESNDLTATVTWADIPDANVPQSAVTQHETALTITESQISDLDHYDSSDFNTDFGNKDTDDLSEGSSNLYFTNARAKSAVDKAHVDSLGVDADTVDGQHASAFASSSHNHSASDITSGTLSSARLPTIQYSDTNFANQELNTSSRVQFTSLYFQNSEVSSYTWDDGEMYMDLSHGIYLQRNGTPRLQWSSQNVVAGNNISVTYDSLDKPTISVDQSSGSGLDADTLDGKHASSFVETSDSTIALRSVRSKGTELGVGAGETWSQLESNMSGETLWLGGESGVKIVSSPDNWSSGWGGRNEATLVDGNGNTDFPGRVTIEGIQLQESSDRNALLEITSNTASWAGLQIRNSANDGRWSFMTAGSEAGIYDDENSDWHIKMKENASVSLHYNGNEMLKTTTAGIDVTGTVTADQFNGNGSNLTSVDADRVDGKHVNAGSGDGLLTRNDIAARGWGFTGNIKHEGKVTLEGQLDGSGNGTEMLRLNNKAKVYMEDEFGTSGKLIDLDFVNFNFFAAGDIDGIYGSSIGYFSLVKDPNNFTEAEVDKIHHDERNTYAVYTSTDTSTNINSTGTAIPWTTEVDVSSSSAYDLDTGTHLVTLSEPGVYRVYAAVTYSSSSARVNVGLRIRVDGSLTSARGYNGYVRAASGHNEATSSVEDWIETTTDDETIEIEAVRISSSGTCTCISSASRLVIERKR